jgi:hypothetical protein
VSTEPATAVPAAPDGGSAGVTVVSAMYEAFGRGDAPAVLALLSADVTWDADWGDNFAQRVLLDHFTPRRGHVVA